MRLGWSICLLSCLPRLGGATEFIFHEQGVHDTASLHAARQLESTCARIKVRFRVQIAPDAKGQSLDQELDRLDRGGYEYYVTAASADFGPQHLYWSAARLCHEMRSRPAMRGIYLHELISERVGGMREGFSDADWRNIEAYASCADATGRKIIWSEWAGGGWGWNTFLREASDAHSLGHRVVRDHAHTFVFLWANNRDLRASDQRADMEGAKRAVRALGDATNPSRPRGFLNPVRRSFAHGISIQDWYWFENHKDSRGQIDPQVMAALPAAMVTEFGIPEFQSGGRYYQFEGYWSPYPANSSGRYWPGFFKGISDLRNYIVRAEHCSP